MSNLYNNYGNPTGQNKLSWLLVNGSSKWKRAGITDEREWREVSRLFAVLLLQGSKMAANLAPWWPATVALGLAGKQLARGEERGAR